MSRSDPKSQSSAYLTWSRGKLQSVAECPACQCVDRSTQSYTRRDDYVSMPDVWTMVTCASCDSLYLDPRPDDESLPRIYDNYLTHSRVPEVIPETGGSRLLWRLIHGYLADNFGLSRQPASRIGAALFKVAVPWRQKLDHYCRDLDLSSYPDRGLLLDLGCGNGAFLERAREMGWDAVGCEPDSVAVELCRSVGLNVIHGDVFSEQLNGREFDALTASHVIEHVPDMHRVLSRVFSLVRPGGTAWFAFPNPNSFSLRLFGAAAVALHIPYHICIPSQRQFSKMLSNVGFTDVRMIRTGIQSPSNWVESERIATEQDLARPGRLRLRFVRLLSDLLSIASVRWSEESVFVARKS